MTLSAICIDQAVLKSYPNARIRILSAHFSETPAFSMPDADALCAMVQQHGLDACTYTQHPDIKVWRNLFTQDFQVNPKTCRPSIDALVRGVLRGKGLPDILPIVNLYNVCSITTLLPMGGYDLTQLQGTRTLRFGKPSDTFHALHGQTTQTVHPQHVVYADDSTVVCWLWNHKDALATRITQHTRDVLFCIDTLDYTRHSISLEQALHTLSQMITQAGGVVREQAIISDTAPCFMCKG